MKLRVYILYVLVMMAVLPAFGQENRVPAGTPMARFLKSAPVKDANVSLLIIRTDRDKRDSVIAEYRSTCPTPQASTMKLVTTCTALEKFGPSYRFPTTLEIDGFMDTTGVVHGNLYIRGSGDPSLATTSAYLGDTIVVDHWADTLVALGVREIQGAVIGDASWADPSACLNPKWLWEDVVEGYATGSWGLCFRDNPVVTRSLMYYIEAPKPPLMLAEELTQKLLMRGVTVGKPAEHMVESQKGLQMRCKLFTHQSDSLAEIIKHCNRRSDNMYAEQLFLLNGKQKNKPATIEDAIKAEYAFWNKKLPTLKRDVILDGSGLSAQDGLSAKTLVSLLTYMKTSKYYKQFHESLAVSGVFGTFSTFLNETPLKGKVFGKSGTTSRIKAYAGYVELHHANYTFAVIVNNQNGTTKEAKQAIEQLLLEYCKE